MNASVPLPPLQIERLRRRTSCFRTAKKVAAVSLGIFFILLVVPLPIPLANLLFPGVSFAMTLYGASLLHGALACPHCRALTRLNHHWVCGVCTFEHTARHMLFGHTFVETCARPKCGATPHSLICWNCREPIIFDESPFKPETSAWLPDSPPRTQPPKPVVKDRPPKILKDHLR
jgi:hypothetical protein